MASFPHLERVSGPVAPGNIDTLRTALENLSPEITLDEDIRKRALVPIERMLALGK